MTASLSSVFVQVCNTRSAVTSILQQIARNIHTYNNAPPIRITVPKKLDEKIRKLDKLSADNPHKKPQSRQLCVVQCKNKQKNHYLGQRFDQKGTVLEKVGVRKYARNKSLASYGWMHSKAQGDYFVLNAYGGNPSTQVAEEDEAQTFADLELDEGLVNGLAEHRLTHLTKIQRTCISKLLDGGNVLCAAETGSGKTLAYLVPIVHRILQRKKALDGAITLNTPQAVIVLPSHELVMQVAAVVEMIGSFLPIKGFALIGGQAPTRHKKKEVDILIGTPGALGNAIKRRFNPSQVQTLVLDEGDTLLDASFLPLTRFLITRIGVRTDQVEGEEELLTGTQIAIVGATMPRHLDKMLGDIIPLDTLTEVTTPHLHRLMPHVPQKFLKIKAEDKPTAILKACKTALKSNITTMIFCNRTNTCHWLDRFLIENDVPHLALHGHLDSEARLEVFEKFQTGESPLLVCTDIASRGLDTIRVQHIVNYDFPFYMSDYIHRIGRVGRVGCKKTGYALSYVTYDWNVGLVWEIETAARKMADLNNVNADIKTIIMKIHEAKTPVEEQILM